MGTNGRRNVRAMAHSPLGGDYHTTSYTDRGEPDARRAIRRSRAGRVDAEIVRVIKFLKYIVFCRERQAPDRCRIDTEQTQPGERRSTSRWALFVCGVCRVYRGCSDYRISLLIALPSQPSSMA